MRKRFHNSWTSGGQYLTDSGSYRRPAPLGDWARFDACHVCPAAAGEPCLTVSPPGIARLPKPLKRPHRDRRKLG